MRVWANELEVIAVLQWVQDRADQVSLHLPEEKPVLTSPVRR